MIGFEKVASVYAEALLLASIDAGTAQELESDLTEISGAFRADPAVWAFFKSPVVDVHQKVDLLGLTLKGKVTDSIYAFLCLMCVRRRFELLPDVVVALQALMDQHLKRKRVQVFTAVPLSNEHRDELKASLEKKLKMDVVLDLIEQPDLMGGLVIRTGDMKEDSSIKDGLARIYKSLMGKRILGESYYA
ncbi:MAG: ATP synthase F1 subunit delta [Spirochaetia bacterium]|nr:ATP synthase F1 subunit delta [Spirochaetia bacterium]